MFAIGEASRLSGVGIEAIRYYERQGIVPRPARAANNRRLYSPADVGRLRFLRTCRDLGFSLADTRILLAFSERPDPDCGSVQRLAERQIASVRNKIAELGRLEAGLRELSQNCSAGRLDCPMLDRLREV